MKGYDFVIVGAGSAGCVLANRLSADPAVQVLLIEAGPRDRSLRVQIPGLVLSLLSKPNPRNWFRWTEPQDAFEGRRILWHAGRGWGGTSSINGMAYVRGQAEDYDGWAETGLTGWSYEDLLPYFLRAEDNERGAGRFHGVGGPLHVSDGRARYPLSDALIAAALDCGYPHNPDINGARQDGFGRIQSTVRRGRRWSSAAAYLHPALSRPNLTVVSDATVSGIRIDSGRATGVRFGRKGRAYEVAAGHEVILSAGSVGSPQLLMLSGVGDAEALRRLDIPVAADRPEVGRNLQDHVLCQIRQACTQPVTLYNQMRPLGMIRTALRYAIGGAGPAGGIGVDVYGAVRSDPGLATPDIHMCLINALLDDMAVTRHGYTLNIWHLRPESRGTITLRSADPGDAPVIQPRYLTGGAELAGLREALKIGRDILAAAPFDDYRGAELSPGPDVQSDAEIEAYIRRTGSGLFHPVGTARMGVDADAVVDARLRVNGIGGLRVVDAAIMPRIVSGNTNAPVIAIAEKAADMILADAGARLRAIA